MKSLLALIIIGFANPSFANSCTVETLKKAYLGQKQVLSRADQEQLVSMLSELIDLGFEVNAESISLSVEVLEGHTIDDVIGNGVRMNLKAAPVEVKQYSENPAVTKREVEPFSTSIELIFDEKDENCETITALQFKNKYIDIVDVSEDDDVQDLMISIFSDGEPVELSVVFNFLSNQATMIDEDGEVTKVALDPATAENIKASFKRSK